MLSLPLFSSPYPPRRRASMALQPSSNFCCLRRTGATPIRRYPPGSVAGPTHPGRSKAPTSSMVTDSNRTFHPFLRISALESREAIYTAYFHALTGGWPLVINFDHFRSITKAIWCPPFLPSLCRTSHNVLQESAPVFIRNSIFVVWGWPNNYLLTSFLKTLGNGFASVCSKHVRDAQH